MPAAEKAEAELSDAKRIRDEAQTTQQKHQVKLHNLRLQERNQALAAEVQDLKQGMEAIEEKARSEMGMIKEGETFYQIVEQTGQKGLENEK